MGSLSCIGAFRGHTAACNAVACNPLVLPGLVLSASQDQTVRWWRMDQMTPIVSEGVTPAVAEAGATGVVGKAGRGGAYKDGAVKTKQKGAGVGLMLEGPSAATAATPAAATKLAAAAAAATQASSATATAAHLKAQLMEREAPPPAAVADADAAAGSKSEAAADDDDDHDETVAAASAAGMCAGSSSQAAPLAPGSQEGQKVKGHVVTTATTAAAAAAATLEERYDVVNEAEAGMGLRPASVNIAGPLLAAAATSTAVPAHALELPPDGGATATAGTPAAATSATAASSGATAGVLATAANAPGGGSSSSGASIKAAVAPGTGRRQRSFICPGRKSAVPPLPDFASVVNQELGADACLALVRMIYPLPGEIEGEIGGEGEGGAGWEGNAGEVGGEGWGGRGTEAATAAEKVTLMGGGTNLGGAAAEAEAEAASAAAMAAVGVEQPTAAAAGAERVTPGAVQPRPLNFSLEVQQMLALMVADPAAILTLADSNTSSPPSAAAAGAAGGGGNTAAVTTAAPTTNISTSTNTIPSTSSSSSSSTQHLLQPSHAAGGALAEVTHGSEGSSSEPLIQGLGVDRRAVLQYMQGDVAGFLQTAVAATAVDGEVVGLAVAGGEELWRAAGRLYAARCTAEGRVREAAVQLLAMVDVEGAAEVYR